MKGVTLEMKRSISIILLLLLLFVPANLSYATENVGFGEENHIEQAIEDKINRLLNYYYNSLAYFENEDYYNICVDNENTNFFKSFVEYDSEAKKIIDCQIKDYSVSWVLKDCVIEPSEANVTISADFRFNYFDSETSSGIHNIIYNFTLQPVDGEWLISAIDSKFPGFERVKRLLSEDAELRANASESAVKAIFARELEKIRESLINEEKLAGSGGAYLDQEPAEEFFETLGTNASSYSYSSIKAVSWARDHVLDGTDGYFTYDPGGNCQNFVSQCVWAGYGGPTAGSGDITQNILNDVRMVPGSSGWYGCLNGYANNCSAWISVNSFWNYATANKEKGPRATGYNDEGLYTGIAADDIPEGSVLQLRNGLRPNNDGKYQHSVICTEVKSDVTSNMYSKVRVCSNTSDYDNVQLKSYMIDWFGGDQCYMRMLKMKAGNFDS